ncbi:MAG: hypothetical protein KDA61_02885, partial [Planctomycetales bacterium]|nr:hypothetical protein [Planctomycetales bacterium]
MGSNSPPAPPLGGEALQSELALDGVFDDVSYDQWRAEVEASLKGAPFEKKLVSATYDDFSIQPLYGSHDAVAEEITGVPGSLPFVRGAAPGERNQGFELRQAYRGPNLAHAREEIAFDVEGGVASLELDLAACDSDGEELLAGLPLFSLDDLEQALGAAPLDRVSVALHAGDAFLPAAAALAALWKRRGIADEAACGEFGADPLGTLARRGNLPFEISRALDLTAVLAKACVARYPGVRAVTVDSTPYHDGGASAAQDIAFAAATGVEYVRALVERGVDVEQAFAQLVFRMGIGCHYFLAIAKLRAARRVWARIAEASGVTSSAARMRQHVGIGTRSLTQRAPHLNLLRNTTSLFAAAVGGADAATSEPFDAACGQANELSRRVARNTAWVLLEEGSLGRVADP